MSIGVTRRPATSFQPPNRPPVNNRPPATPATRYSPLGHTHKERDITDLDRYRQSQLYTKSDLYNKTEIQAFINDVKNEWIAATADLTATDDKGFIAEHATPATRVNITLPATSNVGNKFKVTTGANTGGWKIGQQTGQQIRYGSLLSTLGSTGYVESGAMGASAELVCVVANTKWNVTNSVGTLTVV